MKITKWNQLIPGRLYKYTGWHNHCNLVVKYLGIVKSHLKYQTILSDTHEYPVGGYWNFTTVEIAKKEYNIPFDIEEL